MSNGADAENSAFAAALATGARRPPGGPPDAADLIFGALEDLPRSVRARGILGPVVTADEGSVTIDLLPAAHPLRRP